jgi:predicted type IV restriction endonuclease
MAKQKAAAATKSSAPREISALVAKFAEHQEVYARGDYNETQLRQDFLDPFFAALGWDMDNRQGYAEKFREVIHEDAIRVEQSARAVACVNRHQQAG